MSIQVISGYVFSRQNQNMSCFPIMLLFLPKKRPNLRKKQAFLPKKVKNDGIDFDSSDKSTMKWADKGKK